MVLGILPRVILWLFIMSSLAISWIYKNSRFKRHNKKKIDILTSILSQKKIACFNLIRILHVDSNVSDFQTSWLMSLPFTARLVTDSKCQLTFDIILHSVIQTVPWFFLVMLFSLFLGFRVSSVFNALLMISGSWLDLKTPICLILKGHVLILFSRLTKLVSIDKFLVLMKILKYSKFCQIGCWNFLNDYFKGLLNPDWGAFKKPNSFLKAFHVVVSLFSFAFLVWFMFLDFFTFGPPHFSWFPWSSPPPLCFVELARNHGSFILDKSAAVTIKWPSPSVISAYFTCFFLVLMCLTCCWIWLLKSQ